MEKLLQLCELFRVDLDTLVRGDAESQSVTDSAGYDAHMNAFTLSICTGVATVLFGVTALVLLGGLGLNEALCTMIFFAFVIIGAVVLIVGGIQHGIFTEKHPHITPFYKDEQIDAYNRKFPWLIAVPVALVLLGVVATLGCEAIPCPAGFTKDAWESVFASLLLLSVTLATPIFIYAGMQKAKFNIKEYNEDASPDEETKKRNAVVDKVSGCVMMVATIAFLLMGFLWNLWHIAWVAFPVGGILCGIVSLIMKKD